jgi:hypothetical protein
MATEFKFNSLNLKNDKTNISIDSANNGLIKLNTDCMGFYLVYYPEQDSDNTIE